MRNLISTIFFLLFFEVSFAQVRFKPDTTINSKVILLNRKSVLNNLGNLNRSIINDNEASRVIITNKNADQYLTLYQLSGSNANTFNEFEVCYATNNSALSLKSKESEFLTESGIKLGMPIKVVLAIKGKPNKTSVQHNDQVFFYMVTDKNNPLLKSKNMALYRVEYLFKQGKLYRFKYGFPNL